MVKLTFPPKTELSRESGADLDFQDILVHWRKSLPTVSYFLGGTSIRFPDGGEIRCFQPAGGTPHAHVPEARWRICDICKIYGIWRWVPELRTYGQELVTGQSGDLLAVQQGDLIPITLRALVAPRGPADFSALSLF